MIFFFIDLYIYVNYFSPFALFNPLSFRLVILNYIHPVFIFLLSQLAGFTIIHQLGRKKLNLRRNTPTL